ncbi:MAG: ComEC/Rec2 family competence protein [bacterium]
MIGRMKKNQILIILSGLVFFNVLAWLVVYDSSKNKFLEVNFFDVGQGDSIFIETPGRAQILIDGGPDSAVLEKLAKEMPFWDRTIDLVILTHPEKDHLAGLLDVLSKYKVENILWTGIIRDTAEYQEWVKLIESEGAKIFIAKAGTRALSESARIDILSPLESLVGQEFKDSNDTSIVAKLTFGESSFLFTGDISKSVEKELNKNDVDSDVLKVGHHGSKTSSGEEFIKEVSPQIAVISAGKNNSYGHPHKEVLDILNEYGIHIYETGKDGDIKIISDGENYAISNF